MELKVYKFIKDCKVTKEDWQTYLDRGTLEHIVANMIITYHQEQVKKLNIDNVSKSFYCNDECIDVAMECETIDRCKEQCEKCKR